MHDGWQVVLSLKNGKVVDRYLWGARQDELLCENDGFVLADHLGSVRKVVDAEGDVVSSLKYSVFGEVWLFTIFERVSKRRNSSQKQEGEAESRNKYHN